VRLRDHSCFQGIFHSCCLEQECSLILKCAHELHSGQHKNIEVVPTLIIPGNECVILEAETGSDELDAAKEDYKTDMDANVGIYQGLDKQECQMVAWQDPTTKAGEQSVHAVMDSAAVGNPDQIPTSLQNFDIVSASNEEHYITRLDPNTIPPCKRLEADRIAREIEAGASHEAMVHSMEADMRGFEEHRAVTTDFSGTETVASPPATSRGADEVSKATDKASAGMIARGQGTVSPMGGYSRRVYPAAFLRDRLADFSPVGRATGRSLTGRS